MNDKLDRKQVEDVIVKNICEALLVPPERVAPSARLLSDLAAESIDIADIRFRLEHDFDMKIDQKAMVESLGANLTAATFDERFTVQFVIDYVYGLLMTQKAGI
jgi:acyl carrier protein